MKENRETQTKLCKMSQSRVFSCPSCQLLLKHLFVYSRRLCSVPHAPVHIRAETEAPLCNFLSRFIGLCCRTPAAQDTSNPHNPKHQRENISRGRKMFPYGCLIKFIHCSRPHEDLLITISVMQNVSCKAFQIQHQGLLI